MSLARTNARKRASEAVAVAFRRLDRWWKFLPIAVAIAVVLVCVALWRAHQERRIVALSTARAYHLLRADTWQGYREAAELLGLRAAEVDPDGAGSLRALALAMLALDWHDSRAAADARAIVDARSTRTVDPAARGRFASASAALALRDGKAGTAVELLSSAGDDPTRHVLTARVALFAGNAAAATESVQRALARDARFPAALALRGDLLRRSRRSTEARDAYAAALDESRQAMRVGDPVAADYLPHARATFGLAKLALSRDVAPPEATAPLSALAGAVDAPPAERGRAALYLSALATRLGDRPTAEAALTALAPVNVQGDARAWLERTAAQLARATGPYRVPAGTPPELVSPSDDDAYVPPLPAPARPPAAEPVRPKLYGFKVHGPAPKKAKQKSRQTKKAPARTPAAGR